MCWSQRFDFERGVPILFLILGVLEQSFTKWGRISEALRRTRVVQTRFIDMNFNMVFVIVKIKHFEG